jgi:hypothetical protein
MLAGYRPVMPTADEHASKCRGSTCSGLMRVRSCGGRGLIRWMRRQSAAVCALTYLCTHRRADSRLARFAARPFKGNPRCLPMKGNVRGRAPRTTPPATAPTRCRGRAASGDAMPFGAGPGPWLHRALAMDAVCQRHAHPRTLLSDACCDRADPLRAGLITCPVAWE